MAFVAKQHLNHDQFGYLAVDAENNRCLGGFGSNYYRSWVFPLYTPQGLTVVQEFPFDHPFHNGFWVAQGPVLFERKESHFWAAPPYRRPNEPLFTHLGRVEAGRAPTIETHMSGVRFTLRSVWRDSQERPVLDETRIVDLFSVNDAAICDMRSAKRAAYGALDYAQTKFGSIGVRVEPRLLPILGGEIIADGCRCASIETDRAGQAHPKRGPVRKLQRQYRAMARRPGLQTGRGAGRRSRPRSRYKVALPPQR